MSILKLMASLCLILTGIGCVRTLEPVLTDDQVIVDKALAGKWTTDEGKDSFVIDAPGPEKTCKIVYTDKDGKKGEFVGRLGKIGDLLIAEIHPVDPAPNASDVYKWHLVPLYSFMVIQQTTPQLRFTTMSSDWLKKYVDAHPDELRLVKAGGDGYVVTSPTADIQKFLLKHAKDEGAMGEPAILNRVDATKPAPGAAK